MTRVLLTSILTLLFALTTTAQETHHRGRGCWRTATAQRVAAARLSNPKKAEKPHYRGQKKGLVILAEFPDMKFKSDHGQEKYYNILNTPGYTSAEGFNGSVADYFRDQSCGLFELQFDVVGPYTTKNKYSYYGENDADGLDKHPEDMIIEMCKAADDAVNFADYDWDGDGEVDEVFVVYAGKGEADSNNKNTIWPHMWALTEAGKNLRLDGHRINVYACANEIMSNGKLDGIGTFCHEFSHCLGLADLYDLNYDGLFGMGPLDVMDAGLYANDSYCPVGYSAFEKMSCGWQEPIVLSDEDITVDSLKPMSMQGDFYIIYNDAHPDEYYLIENRQNQGWDTYMPASGLMISHVDYDEDVWYNNIPNTIVKEESAWQEGYTCGNDHERMTIFHADNKAGYYDTRNDFYPYAKNDSLTATSKPAATLYHNNSLGMKLMMGSILDIRQNTGADGTVAFRYRAVNPIVTGIDSPNTKHQTPNTQHQTPNTKHQTPNTKHPSPIYTLDGRMVGTSTESLPHGIYIIGRQKVVR